MVQLTAASGKAVRLSGHPTGNGIEIGGEVNWVVFWSGYVKVGLFGVRDPGKVASALLIEAETDIIFTNNNWSATWVWSFPLGRGTDLSLGVRHTWPIHAGDRFWQWVVDESYNQPYPGWQLNVQYWESFLGVEFPLGEAGRESSDSIVLGGLIRFPQAGMHLEFGYLDWSVGVQDVHVGPIILGSFTFRHRY